jgi:hypothetical protein
MKSKRMEFVMNIVTSNMIAAALACGLLFCSGEVIDGVVGLQIGKALFLMTCATVLLGALAK